MICATPSAATTTRRSRSFSGPVAGSTLAWCTLDDPLPAYAARPAGFIHAQCILHDPLVQDPCLRHFAPLAMLVRDNPALNRFELDAEGHTAVAYYRLTPGL